MTSIYQSPLSTRYSSRKMQSIFSDLHRARTWRKLWVALAEAEKELGLPITDEQIHQLKESQNEVPFEAVERYEAKLKHDVMAHIHAYGEQCPKAKGILHWGATSSYVTDNGDLILYKEALSLLHVKLLEIVRSFLHFCRQNRDVPCMGYTHFQPAQPTTIGKRGCLWLQDFFWDLQELERRLLDLPFLGVKGATGTQASFLSLFNGNASQVHSLEDKVTKKMGFTRALTIASQTYPRKIDIAILSLLANISESAHKFAVDIRLLSNTGELMEGKEASQVGSSAMPYKSNPVKSERVCGLARFVMNLLPNSYQTASQQWLERSLDDSSNRRLAMTEAFLATDGILNLLHNLVPSLVMNKNLIQRKLDAELPFLLSENLLMLLVKKGQSRQEMHERMRNHAFFAKEAMFKEDRSNDFLERLANDPFIPLSFDEIETQSHLEDLLGCASSQVEDFLQQEVVPYLQKFESLHYLFEETPI